MEKCCFQSACAFQAESAAQLGPLYLTTCCRATEACKILLLLGRSYLGITEAFERPSPKTNSLPISRWFSTYHDTRSRGPNSTATVVREPVMALAALRSARRLGLYTSPHKGLFRQANTSAAESFMAELQVQVAGADAFM